MAHDMLHMMNTRCVARDLHTAGHLSEHVGDSLQCSEATVKNRKFHLSMQSSLYLPYLKTNCDLL